MEKTDVEKQPPTQEEEPVQYHHHQESVTTPLNNANNPLYCSYVDGQFTYKDPNTGVQHVWNENEKRWVVKESTTDNGLGGGGGSAEEVDSNKLQEREKGPSADEEQNSEISSKNEMVSPGTSQVQFDGENYTYTDQDGTVFVWDSQKGAWFPKDAPSTSPHASQFTLPPSPPDLSSSSTQTIGFFNPNYSTQLTSPTTVTSSTATTTDHSASTSSRRFYYASLSPTSMGVNENPGLFLSPDDQVNNNDQVQNTNESSLELESSNALPPGWEKHEDTNGPYYWHVKSGTIQRERPTLNSPVSSAVTQISNNPALMIPGGMDGGISGFVRRSNTVSGISSGGGAAVNNEKRRSWVNYLDDGVGRNEYHRDNNQRDVLTGGGGGGGSNNSIVCNSIPAYEFDKHALKFAAVSLGCLSISEEDLTPERSSRAVSKVIAELTSGGGGGANKDNNERGIRISSELPSRIWTHTDACTPSNQQMYLELTDSHLRVKVHRLDGSSNQATPITVLEQPIHSIRVWGVGREDPRDFAFVAREKQTRQFLCHVFRLDMYARPLASSLRDACKKIMIERNARVSGGGTKRPTSLGLKKNNNNEGRGVVVGGGVDKNGSIMNTNGSTTTAANTTTGGLVGGGLFPTPMDEPRKMIKAYYLGSKSVGKPTGMDVLNSAIDGLKSHGVEKIPVMVSVAPSVIGITSTTESPPKVQLEVRVRFLSFMGIGTDVRTCGIIIHTSRDDFEAHCFYQTPSTGALCKAIEAACVLRYQKCLDAHHPVDNAVSNNKDERVGGTRSASSHHNDNVSSSTTSSTATSPRAAALASALKTVFSSFGKAKSEEK